MQDGTPGEQHCRSGTPYCLATLSVNVQLRGTSAAVGTGTITAVELLTVQYVSLCVTGVLSTHSQVPLCDLVWFTHDRWEA